MDGRYEESIWEISKILREENGCKEAADVLEAYMDKRRRTIGWKKDALKNKKAENDTG